MSGISDGRFCSGRYGSSRENFLEEIEISDMDIGRHYQVIGSSAGAVWVVWELNFWRPKTQMCLQICRHLENLKSTENRLNTARGIMKSIIFQPQSSKLTIEAESDGLPGCSGLLALELA